MRLAVVVLACACSKKTETPPAPGSGSGSAMKAPAPGPAPVAGPCVFPTKMAATPDETAWQLFVAATCPVGTSYPYVAWENWIEQSQLFDPGAAKLAANERPRFHASPLAEAIARKQPLKFQIANQDCNSATKSGRTICEEARMSPDTQKYMTSNSLLTVTGEEAFIGASKTFELTPPSIEIKADWILLPSCDGPPAGVHVEQVAGKCYALGGMHLISKLTENWVWATFEPQNPVTNPQRCVVLGCNDPWGVTPGAIPAGPTIPDSTLNAGLAQLMTDAKLAPEWRNYRLDGVQTAYVDASGQPTLLGNSIIEGDNVGADLKTSSCMTCHDASSIDSQGNQGNPDFVVGNPAPLAPGLVRRDFVWAFLLAH
ncbi:MAG TPA: hypothetical protein VGM88_33005 [Kofleriaceae bacterium]